MNLTDWQRARLEAFKSRTGGKVFASIAQPQDVWAGDPFDEESIHAEAREVFIDLLEAAADRERGGGAGRILLLKGDAGAGKTHLMGAFRHEVERRGAGYFAYAQMSTGAPSLHQYLLRNVVESLQRPGPLGQQSSAWMRLSDALIERPCIPPEDREALRNDENYLRSLHDARARLLEDLSRAHDGISPLHPDFLTGLLVLQRRAGNPASAAMKYFRADPLSEWDLQWLGSPQGLAGAGDPGQMLDWLLRAVREFGGAHGGAFVLCLDQMESLYDRNAPRQKRFPELVSAVRELSSNHPGLLVVLACLQDYYTAMRDELLPTDIARLEEPPGPVILRTERTADEIASLVGRRLEVLDGEAGLTAPNAGEDPLFPFAAAEIANLNGLRPRAVLHACYQAWRRSRSGDGLPDLTPDGPQPEKPAAPEPESDWPQRWNDYRVAWNEALPKESAALAALLAVSVNELAKQTGFTLRAQAAADLVTVALGSRTELAAICNAPAQGGHLTRQLDSLQKASADAGYPAVAVRWTDFAKGPKTMIAKRVQKFIIDGSRTVIAPEADWHALQAWQAFAAKQGSDPDFARWASRDRPLAEVPGLRELVRFEAMQPNSLEGEPPPAEPLPVAPPPVDPQPELDPGRILLGTDAGLRAGPTWIEPSWMTEHFAVLGSTGSGKTTAAMVLIEGLLLRGVPVILVDRKGDLARYADSAAIAALPGPAGKLLRDRVDVALYTPGEERGRSLALSVLPARPAKATTADIRLLAADAGAALAAVLGLKLAARRAALTTGIEVLLEMEDQAATLDGLLDLMRNEDPALLQALGGLDRRNLATLEQNLVSFRILSKHLLSEGAEPLHAERLLGLGPYAAPGKTRLTVISTKFLGGNENVQFWVAQLMLELARFCSANPSRTLQAVILLDEADLYLPAQSSPASKAPVENALRRFRSGGFGVMLATQSPGDLDYRCRQNIGAWLVGKVTQNTAIQKLKPVFPESSTGLLEKLGQHSTGEFCLVRDGRAHKIRTSRNLLPTQQMSDPEILLAARATLPVSG